MPINIVEAYIQARGQLVLVISGLSGCGKKKVAKLVADEMKLVFLDQYDYYRENYQNTVKVAKTPDESGDTIEVTDWVSSDAVDWDKFNNDINNVKNKGVVICGFNLNSNFIRFSIDYQIHMSVNKGACIEKRIKFVRKNGDNYLEDLELVKNGTYETVMYKWVFPQYEKIIKDMKINKFVKVGESSADELVQVVWDLFISYISKEMDNFMKFEYKKWSQQNKFIEA
jgi:adenylate kinase family enzyme